MGYFAIACAIFCAAVIGACIWAGSVLSVVGVCVYAYLDRAFASQLRRERGLAYHEGERAGRALGERLRAYNESPLPKTQKEVEETKEWAEGLAALYPQDLALKAEVDKIRKERDMLDKNDG